MSKFQLVMASVVTAVWVITLFIRMFRPVNVTDFTVLDSTVLLVFAFIYGMNAVRKVGPLPPSMSIDEVPKPSSDEAQELGRAGLVEIGQAQLIEDEEVETK